MKIFVQKKKTKQIFVQKKKTKQKIY